jgi:TonB family protein
MNNKYTWLRRLPVLLGLALCLLILMGVYFVKDKFHKPPQLKKVVQQITMIQPPAPPPPLPQEQKPQEPEVREEKIDEPEPMPEPAPVPDQSKEPTPAELGLDAEGVAGTDGFGLDANKGGSSLLGGGGGGNAILWYGGQIQRQLEEGLQNLLADTAAMKSDYSVIIEVWVDTDGRISRSELASGCGKANVDQAIREALPRLRLSIGKPPPENMPQPIKVRLTARI